MRLNPVLALLACAAALPGCGGGDDGGTTTSAPAAAATPSAAIRQDAESKAGARELVSYLESCFVDQASYAPCRSADALGLKGSSEVQLGAGPGQVEIQDATAATYVVVSRSESGNTFTIEKTADGSLKRSCEAKADEGGCKGGTW